METDSGIKKEGVIVGNMSGAAVSWQELATGNCILDGDGKLLKLAQVLRAYQLRDTHSRERGMRFWVGRLRSFEPELSEPFCPRPPDPPPHGPPLFPVIRFPFIVFLTFTL